MNVFARRIGAALSPLILVAGCLVSFDDFPVAGGAASDAAAEVAVGGSSGFGGSSGAGGSSAAGGSGGVSGSGGSAATGGSAPDAGVGGSAGSSGAAGSPNDAAADGIFGSQCSLAGFWTQPAPPTSAGFVIWFQHSDPLACIAFEVTCSNGPAALTPLPDPTPSECPNGHCWRNQVANCSPGDAQVKFVKDKDIDGTGVCHASFPESAGTLVKSCTFTVEN